MMQPVTLKEVEYIAFRLAREAMSFNEPIPGFSARFPQKLESCLAVPFQTFSGRSLYGTLLAKAGILFYLMIKDHPFQNGNKRIAMTTLLVLLHKNKKWLKADTKEFYNFTMWIASSPASLKAETVKAVEKFLSSHLSEL
ncbi:MAG: type II toxin-antitoxin system death-on-curing family toxin [Candidatus Omnitrophica bacterium]|nr:type II toxin-antitoxin system death-on-curing family toxin [Candidatus Omnitrophota bacterium]